MIREPDKLIYAEESYAIMGACFEVYKYLGCGLPEAAYQEALQIEFRARRVDAQPHPKLEIYYKEHKLTPFFVPDFICYGKIVVELKAEPHIVKAHEGQVLSYLDLTGHKLGLLVNFGHYPLIEHKRLAN